jgi:hypothetical protein
MNSYNPKVKVRVKLSAHGDQWEDVSADLVSLSTSKAYGRAAGAWHLTLPFRTLKKYALRYDEICTTNDIVTIEMDGGDGRGNTLVMLGLINRIGQVWSQDQEGRPQRSVKLAGFDFGKLLLRHDCGWSITAKEGNEGNPMILRMSQDLRFEGTAEKIVGGIFKALFLNDVKTMAPYFEFKPRTDDDWETFNTAVFYQTGAAWSAMTQNSNHPWNILTTETDPDPTRLKFSVILEKNPIRDDGYLSHETFITLHTPAIVRADVGVCDDERVNYFWLQTSLTIEGVDEKLPVFLVLDGIVNFDDPSVARNGFNGQIISTNFSKLVKKGDTVASPGFVKELAKRSTAFWNRLKNNHKLWSGSFTLHLNPHVRAGSAVIEKFTKREYLVEQVDHQITFGDTPQFHTTLAVTRGQVHPA